MNKSGRKKRMINCNIYKNKELKLIINTYPLECSCSNIDKDSTAIQATISSERLEKNIILYEIKKAKNIYIYIC